MRQLLGILPKPSRYVGIEEGSVHKKPESVALRLALAFPDLYEVGMSYLGQKLLYGLVNERRDWWAERVFAPCAEAGRILKEHASPLCSLESDTPLSEFDLVGFSLTHELCYTNILYMLDLAGIPLRSANRHAWGATTGGGWPLVIAGGGCTLAAEPVAPFFDLMYLGDGEDVLPELLDFLHEAKDRGLSKNSVLEQAALFPGIYAPSNFEYDGPRRPPRPLRDGRASITRRSVVSLDDTFYPIHQVVPFGAVHNRLTLEIARGCTRGCRFCQAGIIYRPVRERKLDNLKSLMDRCLAETGYDDVSYLSLSTGDFSALKTFFNATIDRCAAEQIAVSLPSLRVGSIDDSIMERMAKIRRTGATLAPEAGSQRLRDVINKGISEEQIILHTQKLFEYGWQQVKLYFMIGLPTETDDDIQAIIELCRKVRDAAGPGIKRMQVTASVSPFVPKPHTPFQWQNQISLAEMRRRIGLLLEAVKTEKRIQLRWHKPEMSFLEGVFSRGDRRLAPVLETAYKKGAIFTSWIDQFELDPWLESLAEHALDPLEFSAGFKTDDPLPWDHLQSGVSKEFLLRERERALAGKVTDDCRYFACRQCGVCDTKAGPASLPKKHVADEFHNILNFAQRDQEANQARLDEYGRVLTRSGIRIKTPPALATGLSQKVAHYRIWYKKTGAAVSLSQLELQAVFERAMRRGGLALSFSQGFKPAPLVSFARALPVGVASLGEWFSIHLRESAEPAQVLSAFKNMPVGLAAVRVEKLTLNRRPAESVEERFRLEWTGLAERLGDFKDAAHVLAASATPLSWVKKGKKQDKELDISSMIRHIGQTEPGTYELTFDWSGGYASPLALAQAALGLSFNGDAGYFSVHEFLLTKLSQSEVLRTS